MPEKANILTLPLLITRALVIFPGNQQLIEAGREFSIDAIKASKAMKLKEAVPFLIYRAKNDSEKIIKEESVRTIGFLNTDEGNDFLIEQLKDKKTGDGNKKVIIAVLLEEKHTGQKEILELADECVNDDKRKDLRYAIGKELAKYENSAFKDICLKYLKSKDAATINLGLDIYKNNRFSEAEAVMREIAADKKANGNVKKRIKKMLSIEDTAD